MVKSLKDAITRLEKLPDREQEQIASWLLAELEDERRWDESFARSQTQLAQMAKEALEEDARGLTRPFETERDLEDD